MQATRCAEGTLYGHSGDVDLSNTTTVPILPPAPECTLQHHANYVGEPHLMSKLETPMILAYWERVGGTLIEEFQLVKGDAASGPRRADAVKDRSAIGYPRVSARSTIEGKDVIVVQAKAERLGMYLMGQGVFSAELIKRFKPKSVKSVILCSNGDATLLPLLASFANVTVEVMKLSPISVDAFEPPATASRDETAESSRARQGGADRSSG
jgi:hypothetical protein